MSFYINKTVVIKRVLGQTFFIEELKDNSYLMRSNTGKLYDLHADVFHYSVKSGAIKVIADVNVITSNIQEPKEDIQNYFSFDDM